MIFDHLVTAATRTLRWWMSTPYVPSVSGSTASFNANAGVVGQLTVVEAAAATIAVSDRTGLLANVQNYIGTARRIDVSQTGTDASFLCVIDLGGTLLSAQASAVHQVTPAFSSGQTKLVPFFLAGVPGLRSITIAG